jgi:hypothetical protein
VDMLSSSLSRSEGSTDVIIPDMTPWS